MDDEELSDGADVDQGADQNTESGLADQAESDLRNAKTRSRWFFWISTSIITALSVLAIGATNKWEWINDLGRPLSAWHWSVYRDMALALFGGSAVAGAASQRIRLTQAKKVVKNVVQANKTLMQEIRHIHNVYNSYTVPEEYAESLRSLRQQVQAVETLFKRAEPDHIRELEKLLGHARDHRIQELEEQLGKDVQLFDGLLSALGSIAKECEAGRVASASARRRA